ncbi:MAG: hypothetical protein ACR2HG_07645 [Pyrinomonadaceae bacterium]
MKKLCPDCRLINFPNAPECVRCRRQLIEVSNVRGDGAEKSSVKSKIIRRAMVCALICALTLLGFYLSMIFTSKPLSYEEKKQVQNAVRVLDEKGFSREVFLLEYLTNFRSNDNWLNASTKFENAYAATNFPLEIMTVYPDFFTDAKDDTERAAILLHEAQHLKGANERQAYEFVWRNRKRLGWTKEAYGNSTVWRNVRQQTREFAPNLFVCGWNETGDCTE